MTTDGPVAVSPDGGTAGARAGPQAGPGGPIDGADSRRAGRNVVAVMAGDVLGKAATVVFTVVVARHLGATDFGSFSYALALGLLLSTFIAWGFDAEVLRRGSVDSSVLGEVLGQALVLRALHAVPVVAVGGLLIAFGRPAGADVTAIVLVVVATLVDGFGDCGRAAATARERPAWSTFALVVQRVVACALAASVVLLGGDLVAVCAAYLVSSGIGAAVLLALLGRLGAHPRFRGLDRGALPGLWRGTFLLGLDAVLSMAVFRVDALLLGAIAGTREVAAYTVAYRLMETVLFVAWAVGRSVFPAMARAAGGPRLLRVGEGALAAAAGLLVPYAVLLVLEGDRLLALLFGPEYGPDSAVTLQLLAFAPLTFALTFLTGVMLFAQGRKVQMVVASGTGLTVNIALNLAVIPVYGAQGAAAATLICYAVQGLLSVGLLSRGNGLLRVDRALLVSGSAALPMGALLVAVDAPLLVEAAAGGVAYVACAVLVARRWAPEQLDLVRSLARRG